MSAIQGKRKSTGMSLFVDDGEKPPTKKASGGLYDSGDEEDRSVPRVGDATVDTSRDEDSSTVSNGTMLKEPHMLKEENETVFVNSRFSNFSVGLSNIVKDFSSLGLEPLQLLSVLGCRRGERDDMQDAHLLLDNFSLGQSFVKRCSLYAIFDGHAGARAAKYCEEHIPSVLMKKLSSYNDPKLMEKHLKRIFAETFKAVDESFLIEARKM
ncbi:unnamed protein product [Angiostrongylus costaricensis]|uniref:PPM-type phosphatase domain-containing protein n=1 Tax=Angiostrongylus costaricensis TaxID=334426 RepID=A0A0R3Q183_ANGCS|nr:unnamed protein product [Angiostrongylus costaricensis]